MSAPPSYRQAQKNWLHFLKKAWGVYLLGVLFVVATALLQVIVARTVGWVLDFFTKEGLPEWLTRANREDTFLGLFLLLVVARILLFITRIGWRVTLARQTHEASSYLKEQLWQHVRYFPKNDLIRTFTKGFLMNANTSDVNSGRFIYGFTLVAICDTLFLGIFTFVAMMTIHVKLSLLSVVTLLILPFFIKKLSTLEMEKYKLAQEDLGDFNDLTSQVVSTIRLQRVTQTGQFWFKRMMDSAEGYRQKRLDAVNTSLRYIPTMGSASIFSYIVLFFMGIPFVFDGSLSVGDFVAMQGLIFLFQDPLFELGFIISEWRKAFTSLERLTDIYKNEKDPALLEKGKDLVPRDCVLLAENLSFQYFDGEEPVFRDLNLKLKRGGRLGITGPIGSGKSTLVRVLSGIERIFEGQVSFMGKEFSEIGHDSLRKSVGYVPQKPFLFADTIRGNIKLDKNLSDSDIWHFLELAGLAKDVRDFPEGLDTPLGEWGINLSGGQKQRLTLARALARKADVYFFDDCLSAVDTVTEERILKRLDEFLREETLIWVAHRRSTLKYCDSIMELGVNNE